MASVSSLPLSGKHPLMCNYIHLDWSLHRACNNQECAWQSKSIAPSSGPPSSRHLVYCTNREGRGVEVLGPGVYGLSNQVLDSPWRKVEVGKERFSQILVGIQPSTSKKELADQLMELLCDTTW